MKGGRMEARKTPLYETHLKAGGKMVEFAGYILPVQYPTGVVKEHLAVRNACGLFDVSHMGEVFISGADSLAFLQKIVPQDVSKLVLGKAVYCQLTNKEGGIIDDLIIYKIENEKENMGAKYLLIVNAARIDEDLNWMVRNSLGFDVIIDNQSHNYSLLAVQGPKSSKLIEKLGLREENQPEYFSIKRAELCSLNVFISRTGYTGEDGFEFLVKNQFSVLLWHEILSEGEEFSIMPIGLGARDTLRLEAGLHLWGNDMDENVTPPEAGLSWSIPKEKTEDYNGKEVILGQMGLIDKKIPKRKKLIGFIMDDNAIARHEYEIYKDNQKIGYVTSGGPSPTLGKNIGMGYIDYDNKYFTSLNNSDITIGMDIQIMIRNKLYNAKVVKRPFVEKKVKMINRSKA